MIMGKGENLKMDTKVDWDWLKSAIIRKTGGKDGTLQTGIAGICFHYHTQDEVLMPHFLEPVIILVAQGTKLAYVGEDKIYCHAGSCLVSAVNMPISSCALTYSGLYLSISIPLNFSIISRLLAETGKQEKLASTHGICSEPADDEMLDAFIRLVKSYDAQKYGEQLAEIIIREIHLRLLMGMWHDAIINLSNAGALGSQIRKAVNWLEEHYKEQTCMMELVNRSCMSKSTFYRCFKSVTTVSPLQYQKRLRLQEARRLMLSEKLSANLAAEIVGYNSASQFNREYKRLYGISPARDSWEQCR